MSESNGKYNKTWEELSDDELLDKIEKENDFMRSKFCSPSLREAASVMLGLYKYHARKRNLI
jgi:hypothetical protein